MRSRRGRRESSEICRSEEATRLESEQQSNADGCGAGITDVVC